MPELTEHHVPGLEAPAEIVVDHWGIPHIRAASRSDAWFVQGLNAARDRLWQIDLWRKRGLGLLAADFGPGFLAQDRAARLFLYRGDMDAEWAAYGTPMAREAADAFVAGINAWIALTEATPSLLPPEFMAMGTKPQRWAAEDLVRIRTHGLSRNALSEVARARVIAGAGEAADLARRSLAPPHAVSVPEGLDPASIPADVLDVFRLASARVDFSPARMAATLETAWAWAKVTDTGNVVSDGSNNWAIAPSRSATGRPILASDPHRLHALPSLRSLVHISAPDMDLIGAGEPCMPGVSLGHNGTAAFSLTIFPADQEDIYVYDVGPDDPDSYRYGASWEKLRIVRETIGVRGQADQAVTLAFTRHGPVLRQDAESRHAYALRGLWAEPGGSPYFASMGYQDARSVEQFADALRHWVAPSVNHVYADTSGRIAWFAAGRVPVRPNWDGLLPVPGDGRYEWAGFHPFEAMPQAIDPARGFVATANEMNLPAGFPHDTISFGYEWAEPWRSSRIHAVLDGQPAHTIDQSLALQTDVLSLPARHLSGLLSTLRANTDDLDIALDLLRAWDHVLASDSAAAALHEVWWSRHLKPALLALVAPDPAVRALLAPGDTTTLLAMLDHPETAPAGARIGNREALLTETLAAAVVECRVRMGDDPGTWAWGRLHHGYFEHPLSALDDGFADVGPLATGGSGSTVMAATYRVGDFRVTNGASVRMVLDVGDWDNSRCINAPGQSGDPRSPHYDDLAPVWAAGHYVPLLYSRAAVDAAAEHVIQLLPA